MIQETSRQAGAAIRPHAPTLRGQVLAAIESSGINGLTDEAGMALTGLAGSTYRPRRIELVARNQVMDLGERRKLTSGRLAIVWFSSTVAAGTAS